ncbi:MAG TPA: peptidase M48 [Aliiroseovarius sp.]|nr:peptidase M48 [Aliiroseovarius sp.]
MNKLAFFLLTFLLACTTTGGDQVRQSPADIQVTDAALAGKISQYQMVANRVEQVARQECRARSRPKCNFKFTIDTRPDVAPNAYQSEDRNGKPVIAFTLSLIADMRNPDEMAFILGHEVSHHILGHLPAVRTGILTGAIAASLEAQMNGLSEEQIQRAETVGALTAIQGFSKEFELQADALGAQIAYQAGFNPVLGSKSFNRVKDPANTFLATHPGNAQRLATVRRVMAGLCADPATRREPPC